MTKDIRLRVSLLIVFLPKTLRAHVLFCIQTSKRIERDVLKEIWKLSDD